MENFLSGKKTRAVSALILISVIVYANALRCDFTLDDNYIIKTNANIRSLRNIPLLFRSNFVNDNKSNLYRPLVALSFALDYRFWKLNPLGYHLNNIMLHTLNGVILYFLYLLILKKSGKSYSHALAFFMSAVFVVHPAHTEAVTNIVGRSEVLCALFVLTGYMAYSRFRETMSPAYYAASLLCFGLSLFSKETGAVLIGIIFLHDIFWTENAGGGISGRIHGIWMNSRYYIAYLAVIASYLSIRMSIFGRIGLPSEMQYFFKESLSTRLFTMSKVVIYYLKTMLVPYPLHVEYGNYSIIRTARYFYEPGVIASMSALLIICVLTILFVKYSRAASFGVIFFFICLLPVLNLVPIGTLLAERFLYLPSAGFILTLTLPFSYYEKWREGTKKAALTACAMIIILFGALTAARNLDWKDDLSINYSTIKVTPGNHIAYYNLGVLLSRNPEKAQEAASCFKKSIELSNYYHAPYVGLAGLYMKQKMYDNAILVAEQASRVSPGNSDDLYILGTAYLNKGDTAKAINIFRKALEITPGRNDISSNLAIALYKSGELTEAARMCRKTIELNPNNAPCYNLLGVINYAAGKTDEAVIDFKKALSIQPGYEEAMSNIKKVKRQ
jgi:protein O-mannosyl-transferase